MVGHGFGQLVGGQGLDALVHRQNDVAAVLRGAAAGVRAVDNLAFVVAQHDFFAVAAVQFAFARAFQAFLPLPVDVGETDGLGKQAAGRVVPLRLFLEGQPGDVHRGNALGQLGF